MTNLSECFVSTFLRWVVLHGTTSSVFCCLLLLDPGDYKRNFYICQVNGVKLADILFSLLCVCVSVCTQSVNRLCTGRWSPWHHRCMACCGKSILRDITVIFLYISPETPPWSWTWLYHEKANKMTFPTISGPYENIVNFSHTQVEYISQRTIRHSAHSNELGHTQSSLQQCVSLPQCISHLADICTLWMPQGSYRPWKVPGKSWN